MGMEVAGSELPQANGDAKLKLHDQENNEVDVSEPIKFGSHGSDEQQQAKVEAKDVSNANFPKDAVDEWPATPQIHSFWLVKYRPYEDANVKAKLDQVDKEIRKSTQQRSEIIDELRAKRSEKAELDAELNSLSSENSQYWAVINEKRQEMKPLQDALGTLRGSGRERGEKGYGICSTEEELNELIRSLEYKIQHESMSLKEEKQLLRDIKELEATRPKVIANSAIRVKIQDSLGQTEVIQDQVKLIGTDLDGVRKQKAVVKAKMDHLIAQRNALRAQIVELQKELETSTNKKDKAFATLHELKKNRDERNANFFLNRTLLNKAKELAARKDVTALEELSHAEVEKFMSQWNSSKSFREDYEKRILTSLDMRQLSRDGRMRNPDEKPLVMPEAPSRPSETEVAASKVAPKSQKDSKTTTKTTTAKEDKLLPDQSEPQKKSKESKRAMEEDDEIFVVENTKKDVQKESKVDEAKLKEIKREEEKEKQRQALERKKKLQEKAATKAALRAQKEAEKKQKEREKKLKKKEGPSGVATNEEEPSEKEAEAVESADTVEEAVETPAAPTKAKENAHAPRYRKASKTTRGSLPKAILKKKKSPNYWVWASAAAAAAVVVMLLAVLGYKYMV